MEVETGDVVGFVLTEMRQRCLLRLVQAVGKGVDLVQEHFDFATHGALSRC